MVHLVSDNFNDIYKQLIATVLGSGAVSAPRGIKVREVIGASFTLTNPLNSLCTIKERKLSYKFSIVEKFEYISGLSNPVRIIHYNKNMSSFLNDKNEFDGAYGPRIGRQVEYIYGLLKRDPDSRQAVFNINSEVDKHSSKDIPCTVSLQLLLRDNKLHMVTYMRSNDILWGTPYDVNGFCFIQEVFAKFLDVELGSYHHHVGSLHIYESTVDQLETVRDSVDYNDKKNHIIDQFSFTNKDFLFACFWEIELKIRTEKIGSDKVIELSTVYGLPSWMQNYLLSLV